MNCRNTIRNFNLSISATDWYLQSGWFLVFFLLSLAVDKASAQKSRLFDSNDELELTVSCDLKAVMRDRGEDPQNHEATVRYEENQEIFDIPVKVKVRGHFRKMSSNCSYPPLYLNFAKSTTPEASLFYGQDKIKLVTPCRGDQYVIHEYLVYKLYNLVTPMSFNARLVKVIYHDRNKDKSSGPYYGILLEEEDQMARRNNARIVEINRLKPEDTEMEFFLQMAVFQYMIGNTDWSVQFLQNIKLITGDFSRLPVTVPYDFDHAGIVQAPYANPAPELRLNSTRERRYRGYCMTRLEPFEKVFDKFNELKNDFYRVYSENLLLDEKYIKQTIRFLDQFYETINDPTKVQEEFGYPCDPNGTGNIVIKGLRKD